jgi:Predicted membrane protein
MLMLGMTLADYIALMIFFGCWLGYNIAVERNLAAGSLNRTMDKYRSVWMRQLVLRENRVVDTTIMASLQSGAAFFASTSLLAIGAALTLFRSADDVLQIMSNFPLGTDVTRLGWEIKVFGLTVIFIYAFFKFSWAYRIFNYAAILVGAVPALKVSQASEEELAEAYEAAERAAKMNTVAGRHFNRGQRAFFFALAYLSWFISAYALMIATIAVMLVMWRRQFASQVIVTTDYYTYPG